MHVSSTDLSTPGQSPQKTLRFKQISIPTPCHEDWSNMTPAEKGKHCSLCNKVVIDFTDKSEEELTTLMGSATGKVCGRFNRKQIRRLSPDIVSPRTLYSRFQVFVIAFFAVFGVSILGAGEVQAQKLMGDPFVHEPAVTQTPAKNEQGQLVTPTLLKLVGTAKYLKGTEYIPISFGQIGIYPKGKEQEISWQIANHAGEFSILVNSAQVEAGELWIRLMDHEILLDQMLTPEEGRIDLLVDPVPIAPIQEVDPDTLEEIDILGEIEMGWVEVDDAFEDFEAEEVSPEDESFL